jgi:hypothetical protein
VEGVALALVSPGEITGTVRVEDGDLQALRKGGVPGQIALTDAEESVGVPATGQIQENETFKFQSFGFSRYWVSVRPLPPGTYVKSIRFSGQDVTKTPLDLSSGAGGVLDIVISQRAAEVTAVARRSNGEMAAGITVSIWPRGNAGFDTGTVRIVNTTATGSVKVSELAPGEYYVAAWEDADSNLLRYPDFLAKFTDQASAVRLGENDKITADLMVIPKEKSAAEAAKLP